MLRDNDFVEMEIDGTSFKLKEESDFSFLKQFGKVFRVFDQNDSGNISFGVQNNFKERFFIKVAGAKTMEAFRDPNEAVLALKQTIEIYEDLRCDKLIDLVNSGTFYNLFFVVFRWSQGECLFDHWNFDLYRKNLELLSPRKKFSLLSKNKKVQVANQIIDFMEYVDTNNYIAVDFYDGSLMYNFENDKLTICDIDFFRTGPIINNIGVDYWGTKRMKAPEEYKLGASIDSRTNVFTIGALFFNIFGHYSSEIIDKMYREYHFIPLEKENWELPMDLYEVTLKAVKPSPNDRYETVQLFKNEWLTACTNLCLI